MTVSAGVKLDVCTVSAIYRKLRNLNIDLYTVVHAVL